MVALHAVRVIAIVVRPLAVGATQRYGGFVWLGVEGVLHGLVTLIVEVCFTFVGDVYSTASVWVGLFVFCVGPAN